MSRSCLCVVESQFASPAADGIAPDMLESIDSLEIIEVDSEELFGHPTPIAWDDDDDEDEEFLDDDDEDLDLGDEEDEDFFDDDDEEGIDEDDEELIEDE